MAEENKNNMDIKNEMLLVRTSGKKQKNNIQKKLKKIKKQNKLNQKEIGNADIIEKALTGFSEVL